MANFRTLSPALWSDPFIEGLSAQEKLLYIYLFSNEHVNNVGYMQATLRKISFETAVPQDAVASFLEKTDRLGKTARDGDAILCLNFVRYQTTRSPQVTKNLRKVFHTVGSAKLRQALLERYPDVFTVVEEHQPPCQEECDTHLTQHQDGSDNISIDPPYGSDTLCRQRQGIAGHSRVKKEKDTPPLPPSPGGGACDLPPAPLSGEDIAEAQDAVRQEHTRGDYEFSLLRQAYDSARQEGPRAGRQEFLALFHSPEWPGIDELVHAVEVLCAEDDQFRRGFAPGLGKFLANRMWRMKPRAPAGEQASSPEDAEGKRKWEELKAKVRADKEARKKRGR